MKKNSYGFTLVEIAFVVMIIGLIITISLPDFNKISGRYNLTISARELASDIRSIQQSAIKTESTGLKIMFDTSTDTYYLLNTAVGLTPCKTKKLPATVDLVFTNFTHNTMNFAANGNPAGRIGGHITLQDRNSRFFYYVIVDSVGRVRVSNKLLKTFFGLGGDRISSYMKHERGFSLIEVLLSFLILAMVLSAAMNNFTISGGINAGTYRYNTAMSLAQSKLEEIKNSTFNSVVSADLQDFSNENDYALFHGFTYAVTVAESGLNSKTVTVTVHYSDAGLPKELALSTEITKR